MPRTDPRPSIQGSLHHNFKHGQSNTPLYNVWQTMHTRCYNPNYFQFGNYGGRGIEICPSWRKDFTKFRKWAIAHGWVKGLHVDRRNGDGNYSPGNCRVVTRVINNRNKRTTILDESSVREMRLLLSLGARVCDVARAFNVKWEHAMKIRDRTIWKGVEPLGS